MELGEKLMKIAKTCAEYVYVPEEVSCCGFAGDKGFTFPELNSSALETLSSSLKSQNCTFGYSSSITCEIGLSLQGDIEYNSIIYLIDECTSNQDKVSI